MDCRIVPMDFKTLQKGLNAELNLTLKTIQHCSELTFNHMIQSVVIVDHVKLLRRDSVTIVNSLFFRQLCELQRPRNAGQSILQINLFEIG